jgi:Immunoglobulin-like domain of bacterial spore germination/Sporulation and spore germination
MRRLVPLVVAAGLLTAACGGAGSGSLGPAPSPSPSPSPHSPTPTPSRSPGPSPSSNRTVTFEVWLLNDGHLFVGQRTEPFVPAVAGLALQALLSGPTPAEAAAGVVSSLPANLQGAITALAGGKATVDFDVRFFQGEDPLIRLREAQVVYTLTQYRTIGTVSFTSGGQPVGTAAFTRKHFDDLLPAILVESPVIGQRVSSPVTVSGTANVFEATVSLRILDENGNEVANTFTTATCGTGCRGDYSVSVPFSVDHEQPGTVEVYESSAKDGSRINVVDIPVTLTT